MADDPDFRVLFEAVPGLYLVLTPQFKIVAASNAYLDATMTTRTQVLGRHMFEVFPDNPGDKAATGVRNLGASLQRVLQNKRSDSMAVQKYDLRRPPPHDQEFEERYWSPVNSAVLDDNGDVRYLIHRVEDVTDYVHLKQTSAFRQTVLESEIHLRNRDLQSANEQLRASLRDKETLLAEVHHRVKNNLQTISSLLSLQADAAGSPAVQDALRQAQDRVRAIADIHELLYQSPNGAHVEVRPLLERVARTLHELHGADRSAIRLIVGIDDVKLDLYYAVPLALIVNELVLNSLKHAFPKSRPGTVHLEFTQAPALFRLLVEDDGVGQSEPGVGSSGLGLQLVELLVEQLGGEILVESSNGRRTAVTFRRE